MVPFPLMAAMAGVLFMLAGVHQFVPVPASAIRITRIFHLLNLPLFRIHRFSPLKKNEGQLLIS
jgi:hypothetical protein